MTLYYGATHNLDALIKTHLFVICLNNSGSTYLKRVLATSRNTWNLVNEGQHTAGFAGPSSRNQNTRRLWATDQWIDLFTDTSAYDWNLIRKAWYFQAYSLNPKASIFVEKSPTFLLNPDQLVQHFNNLRFIFMVRDPYATVEGIRRWRQKKPKNLISQEKDLLQQAATHVMTCFEYQRRNIATYSDSGIFFTYEQMCDQPSYAENLIKSLVPELSDLRIKQQIPVKNYNEILRNMNAQQLANLNKEELGWINQVFENHTNLLEYFGYSWLE